MLKSQIYVSSQIRWSNCVSGTNGKANNQSPKFIESQWGRLINLPDGDTVNCINVVNKEIYEVVPGHILSGANSFVTDLSRFKQRFCRQTVSLYWVFSVKICLVRLLQPKVYLIYPQWHQCTHASFRAFVRPQMHDRNNRRKKLRCVLRVVGRECYYFPLLRRQP